MTQLFLCYAFNIFSSYNVRNISDLSVEKTLVSRDSSARDTIVTPVHLSSSSVNGWKGGVGVGSGGGESVVNKKVKKKSSTNCIIGYMCQLNKLMYNNEGGTLSSSSSSACRLNVNVLLLTVLFLLFTPSNAVFPCLASKCHCVFKSNKLIAECIASNGIPEESPPEKSSDIQILNLTQNTLGELKGKVFQEANLVNLQRIYLKKGSISRIDKLAFFRLTNLIEIDLSYNLLRSIPTEALTLARKLREVDLSYNRIMSVSSNSFVHMVNVKVLNLEGNGLKYLEKDCFLGLVSLETLKLSDNSLSLIDSSLLRPLGQLHSLTLSGNNWICDCSIRPLKQFLMTRRISVYDQPRCTESPSTIWTQTEDDFFICSPQIVPNNSASLPIFVEPGKSISLECAFYVKQTSDLTNLPIQWTWQETSLDDTTSSRKSITNSTKGIVTNQVFLVHEFHAPLTLKINESERMMKVSRLDISLMLQVNQGVYTCHSSNLAGSAGRNYTVIVTKGGTLVTPRSNELAPTKSFIGPHDDEHVDLEEASESDDLQIISVTQGEVVTPHSRESESRNVTLANEITLLPLLIGMITGMLLVLLTFSLILFAIYPCAKVRGHLTSLNRQLSSSHDANHPATCYSFASRASSCYKCTSFTPNCDESCHNISFTDCSRGKITTISDTFNKDPCKGERKKNYKSPKISFSSSPLTSNAWTREMHQLASVEKDETVEDEPVYYHRPSSCHCESRVNEDEREEETQVLNSHHFAACTEYNASITLLKSHRQDVTSGENMDTMASDLQAQSLPANEPDLIHQSRGLDTSSKRVK